MTKVLITVDTELSSSLHRKGLAVSENIARSIHGRTAQGDFGIGWQMDVLDRHGLTGVYFVDPLPALVAGEAMLADIVGPIVARGHEVQMHAHAEWLDFMDNPPVPLNGVTGRNIGDFPFDAQVTLLGLAKAMLERAGAPAITAFRAGNFGANDDTLRALAALGVAWDSSFNADYLDKGCGIALPATTVAATRAQGLIELPVSGIYDRPGHVRPAQICAMSAREMAGGLRHAADNGHASFMIVTHSFEMLSRDRQRPNRSVMRRLEQLCATIARDPRLETAGFATLDPAMADLVPIAAQRLGPSTLRTGLRLAEQAMATWLYERRLIPA